MGSANDKQLGGDHYKSEYEHWDFIEEHGIGYLEAAATKYISRWRRKGGRLDLEKALHYVDKLMELSVARHRLPRGIVPDRAVIRFCAVNQIGDVESVAIRLLVQWEYYEDLLEARERIDTLLKQCPPVEESTHQDHTGQKHPFGYVKGEEQM